VRLQLISLGRWRQSGPERPLYEHYATRFTSLGKALRLGPLELVEIAGKDETPQALMAACAKGAARLVLDSGGAALSSEGLAQLLSKLRDDGRSAAAFLIGGADGLASIVPEADRVLSLGAPTWPHLLVRGLMAEQLYRAATILANHPYHRGH